MGNMPIETGKQNISSIGLRLLAELMLFSQVFAAAELFILYTGIHDNLPWLLSLYNSRILYTIPKNTIPNGHNPEWTQSRMDTIPKGHNLERTQSRMSTYNYIVTLVFNSYCMVRSLLRRRGFKQKLILCMNLSDL